MSLPHALPEILATGLAETLLPADDDAAGPVLAAARSAAHRAVLGAAGDQTVPRDDARHFAVAHDAAQAPTDITVLDVQRSANPKGSVDQFARYMTNGYWKETGQQPHHFDTTPKDNVITVNLQGLPPEQRELARAALEAWEMVADIVFKEVKGGADITFDDTKSGAYSTQSYYTSGETKDAYVNMGKDFVSKYGSTVGSYTFQAYMHEIGHALGLGHAGNYESDSGTNYANDSWQMSLMSYNSQTENKNVDASYAECLTPMTADVVAIQNLYGKPQGGATAGATVYGVGSNLDNYLDPAFAGKEGSLKRDAMTIYDESGQDQINFSNDTSDQRVTLQAETWSDVYGLKGNLGIARGTVIENYVAGSGDDRVTGNQVKNVITGNGGNDVLNGAGGNDILYGNNGNDQLVGGDGSDKVYGGDGQDVLNGGAGNDILNGAAGADAFVFTGGQDIVQGFANDVDEIRIDNAVWGGGSHSIDWVLDQARVVNGDVVFNFGGGDTLTIDNFTNIDALANDLRIV